MKMMKYLYLLVGILALTACEQDLTKADMTNNGTLFINVDGFPAFSETAQTRSVGASDTGKTAWANGDKLLLHLSYTNDKGTQNSYSTLTYDGSTWNCSPTLALENAHSASLTAYYAPTYSWDDSGNLIGTGGTGEFMQTTQNLTNRNVTINFANVTRAYSRLRFASATNTKLTVTLTGFTPAGYHTSVVDNYTATLTTDSKGNAYLYGSWSANARLAVSANYLTTDIVKTLSASTPAQSYALDTPELISSIPPTWNNSTTDITGYYKLNTDITLSGNWTPIGNATTDTDPGRFIGTFDGGGHQIKGLKSESSGDDFGLFRVLGTGGVIKNVNITECSIGGNSSFVAGIVATNFGTIENCHVIGGSITGNAEVGGIVSYNSSGSVVVACSNSANVSGNQNIGGLFSRTYNGTTTLSCFNAGNVTGNSGVGEIAGTGGIYGTVTACYYLDGNSVKRTDGVETTWDAAISDMNSALQAAGYSYQYELDTSSGLPMIKVTD